MRNAADYLNAEIAKHREAALTLTRSAEDENRSLTDDEKTKVEEHVSEATKLKARVEEILATDELKLSIEQLVQHRAEPVEKVEDAKNVGEAFVRSAGYKALKASGMAGKWTTGPVEVPFLAKAPGDPLLVGDLTLPSTPQVLPGIQGPVESQPTIADLLGSGVATQNAIVYLKETLATNGADIVAEGDPKPPSEFDFDIASASVVKIATFLPVSDEMLEDQPQVASYINSRLGLFVRKREETYLLTLILAAAGVENSSAVGGNNLIDAIMAAMTAVRIDADEEPDAVVLHPQDAAKLAVLKSAGDGNYFSGGPFTAAPTTPWGLRSVITTRIAEGRPLVGAFRLGGTVFRKGGLTLEASNSHSDYFVKNLTAIRAEERLALVIHRDAAFCEGVVSGS